MINIGKKTYYYILGIFAVTPVFVYGVTELSIKNNKEYIPEHITTSFSYKEGNKVVGFPEVELLNYEVLNPRTGGLEYFLDDVGEIYLINKLINTGIIGPEISSLKRIVLGDEALADNSNLLGLYSPASRDIHINLKSMWRSITPYIDPLSMSKQEIQERRAEVVSQVLIHEYGHHMFAQYVEAPVENEEMHVISRISNKDRDRASTSWNKKFYTDFYNIFYSNKINLIPNKKVEIAFLKQKIDRFYIKYKNINLFDIANGSEVLGHSNIKKMGLGVYFYSRKTASGIAKKYDSIPVYTNDYNPVDYLFSLQEQLTRKMLLSIFKINPKYFDQTIDPNISDIVGDELTYGNINVETIEAVGQNWLLNIFYGDNIYNVSNNDTDPGKSDDYVKLIDKITGHKDKYELSVSVADTPWELIGIDTINYDPSTLYQTINRLKLGGYLDNDEGFTHVGYIDSENEFVPLSKIHINRYNIGYKRINNESTWVNDSEIDTSDYYWYSSNYIKNEDLLPSNGQKKILAFGTLIDDSGIFTFRKIANARIAPNGYGITSNYDMSLRSIINNRKIQGSFANFQKYSKWTIPTYSELQGISFISREWW